MSDKNTGPQTPEDREAKRVEENLAQIREYAWDWFSYHAGQRTNMFNYALAAAALLAAGYGAVLDQYAIVAAAIGYVGAFVIFLFILLDGRNQQLVRYGENVLKAVERSLFADAKIAGSRLSVNEMPKGILLADSRDTFVRDFLRGKHRIHLRFVEGVLLIVFLAGAVLASCGPARFKADEPESTAAAVDRVARSIDAAAAGLQVIGDKLTPTNANPQAPPP